MARTSFFIRFTICVMVVVFIITLLNIKLAFIQNIPRDVESTESVKHSNRHIVFVKTHKTGGSSIQNIFLRYVSEHDILALIPQATNYVGHPQLFHRDFTQKLKPGYEYRMFVHHTRFDYEEFCSLFNPGGKKGQDPVFVTVVREPISLFQSLFQYYQLSDFVGVDLKTYAQSNHSKLNKFNARYYGRIGRNQMSFDLGLPSYLFDDAKSVHEFAKLLDRQFDLVMVAEHMDESLVLLRHLLNWTVDEVVTFHHNSRRNNTNIRLTSREKENILRWNRADHILYVYFLVRFQERVIDFGYDAMEQEVAFLRKRTREWYNACLGDEDMKDVLTEEQIEKNTVVQYFEPKHKKNRTCSDLIVSELPFTDYLRYKQSRFIEEEKYPSLPPG